MMEEPTKEQTLVDRALAQVAELESKRRFDVLQMAHQFGGTTEQVIERAQAYLYFLSPALRAFRKREEEVAS
jgi:hypothetical protein